MTSTKRGILTAALLTLGASTSQAGFSDVPRDHWARGSIEVAVGEGVLEGYGGRFHGEKVLNRYQLAVVVDRLLQAGARRAPEGGPALEGVMVDMARELAALAERTRGLESLARRVEEDVDAIRTARAAGAPAGRRRYPWQAEAHGPFPAW